MEKLCELTSTTKGFELFEERSSPLSTWKNLKIRGVFQRADTMNQNGRIYPKSVLEQAVYNLQELVSACRCLGCVDHPQDGSPTVMLKDASHMITELKFQGNDLIGTAVILDGPNGTPMGQLLSNLIKSNVTVGISSRGLGSVTQDHYGNTIVNEFKLSTFDAVADPSTHGAFVSRIEESRKMTIEQALAEKNFYDSFREDIRSMISRNLK